MMSFSPSGPVPYTTVQHLFRNVGALGLNTRRSKRNTIFLFLYISSSLLFILHLKWCQCHHLIGNINTRTAEGKHRRVKNKTQNHLHKIIGTVLQYSGYTRSFVFVTTVIFPNIDSVPPAQLTWSALNQIMRPAGFQSHWCDLCA